MKKRVLTKALSLLLALTLLTSLFPAGVLAAGVPETLVNSLAELYDGDEARAREELEALHEAGLLDADGSLVELDIREDGESVELGAVAQRIADGEEVGALTVNGNAATPEKVTQLQQVDSMLEVLRLIDEDVEITDAHVANLQSLLEGIADGSIDLSDVISRGEVQTTANRSMRMLGAANVSAVPTPNTGTGEVQNVTAGKYTAPFISGGTYEASHEFALIDPKNTTWYTESVAVGGDTGSGYTVTMASFMHGKDFSQAYSRNDGFVRGTAYILQVTAELDSTPTVPISIEWSAASNVIPFTSYSKTRGTITWSANDSKLSKSDYIYLDHSIIDSDGFDKWDGIECIMLNAGNAKGADVTFKDKWGGSTNDSNTAWRKAIQILGEDTIDLNSTVNKIVEISAPAGTYFSGQTIPITVTLDKNARAYNGYGSSTLTVNGVECPMLNIRSDRATDGNKFQFGYTVKDIDTGTLIVTALNSNLVGNNDGKVSFQDAFLPVTIGVDDGVILSSNVKEGSLDWEHVKCGIDDAEPGDQTVTAVIPFAEGASSTWITGEMAEINPAIPMAVPDYENAVAIGYLKSAYLSKDGGATRYPVYVLASGEVEGVALAARFSPPANASGYLRKDTLNLYLDNEVGTTANYFGTEQTDAKGFTYYTASDTAAAAAKEMSVSYYVKGCVLFDKDATVARPDYSKDNVKEAGDKRFYQDGALYVAVQGEDALQQYDVELVANEALYNGAVNGVRMEEPNKLVLSYHISGRDNFTFTDPKYFSWASSNEQIATVVKDEKTGAGQIALTGAAGPVTITLTVGNGAESKAYDLTYTFGVLEGKTPFLNIPQFSQERTTLTETDTDVLFASNVTQRNAAGGADTTTFTAKVFKSSTEGEKVWEGSFESTIQQTLTHITVPGTALKTEGSYAVVISAEYKGGELGGMNAAAEKFSAVASLNVKQAPLKVTLNKLESYSADYNALPTIGYTVTPSNANAVVEYTIQKSGEAVGERKTVTGGTISFTADKPTGLKDAYTVTVYAKAKDAAADEPWSVDSMLLRVYNTDMLELIVKDVVAGEIGGTTGGTGENMNGKTVTMDNHSKVENYAKVEGKDYQLSVSDLNALRTDMSLQKLISANYGSGVWGLLSDKMQWESSDSDLVSVNYKQGGFYSDIRNYSYTSYGPATDFLLVGKDKTDGVTITATHAGTGKTASVTVAANTLKDQLYIFQFNPKAETNVVYTNGAGEKRTLTSNEKGELAVYEPEGIQSAVTAMSRSDGQTYVGTIFKSDLESGERDIASLQLYPTNNLRLRSVSNATLTFRNPDGSAYNGTVTLRAGVYKNGVYCPGAEAFLASAPETKYGAQKDIVATVTDGKLTIGFDPTQFKNDPNSTEETGAYPGDKVTYVFEYRVEGYQTSYTMLNVYTDVEGEQKATDSVIQLKTVKGGDGVPQITRQTMQQYSGDEPLPYTRDVIDYTENIGVSKKFNKVVLTTDFVLPSSCVTEDEQGHTTLKGDFALYTVDGRKLKGQTDFSKGADPIINLSALEGSELFVFPFSSSPIGRSVYTMTDANMKEDGVTDEGENPASSTRVRAMFVRDGMTVTSVTLPFGVSNLSHQPDLADPNGGAGTVAKDINKQLSSQVSIGKIFEQVNVNDMLKKGFTFLSGLATSGATPVSLIILPTEDPGVFRIVAFVGVNQDKNKDNKDGVDIEYDEDAMYEDFAEMMEEDDDDDDEEDGGEGEGSVDTSFSGTLVLEAGYDFSAKKWKIDFRGGSVGLGISAKYEWSQNFMCGPVPANISFEVGANVDLEVSFANKSSVKLMLVDATVGVYIEAFAGLGFDASIAKLKLGIYGRIGADLNFLLLSDFKNENPTGTKLDINGEIGIRLEVKVLFVNYKKTFASTGFNWTKTWGKYSEIQRKWEQDGYATLYGFTQSGRAYSMRLLDNGTALVTIEGGGEIENRDYLELAERAWTGGASSGRRLLLAAAPMSNALNNVETNAYPYANPVLTDDGGMFLYISDNGNSEDLQSVVSYAVRNSAGNGYNEGSPLYDTEASGVILADSDVVASGTGNNIFAAWVKQNESPEKEMHDETTYDDLGMMMNATEIFAGSYNGTAWTTERLTTNNVADMSPTVASSGNRAIVAWRSLSATKMPAEGGSQDISTMFNAENNVNYRIYNGSEWTAAQVAYNGAAGTVNAIDSAMLSDGTAILVYTVRTGEDITSTETFYTLIGTDGNVITTGRLTNDSFTDTNAQVTAVGNQFVLGWYSEHNTGEKAIDPETKVEKDIVAHDIRLARINAAGSVDESFSESIGGDAASTITSDFRFSAPANNDALSNLSIVWSQKKDSEIADDAGKYEINAMRFYEAGGAVGMSTQVNIAETDKNVTVDHFDTYTDTDENGTVYALVLASDYSSIEGIEAFDQIDLTNLPVTVENGSAEPASSTLTILEQNPIAKMMLGSGTFPTTAVEVTAKTNLRELVPGLDLPVQFTVKNVGTSTVNSVKVKLGSNAEKAVAVSLLPNESTIITEVYPVPEGAVQNVDYTVTADGVNETGTLILNRPDVGISGMKLLSEKDGVRTVQVTLTNASGIPLEGSGKTVKLGLYMTADHAANDLVGQIITISDDNALADIDDGIYGAVQTLKVTDIAALNANGEIPDEGIRLFAHAWVEDCDELYTKNNDGTLAFKGLLTKNNGETITVDTAIEAKTENETTEYVVRPEIHNNSMQEQKLGKPVAVLLDDQGDKIAQKPMRDDVLTLSKEQVVPLSATFTAQEVNGKTPKLATVNYSYKVSFDVNGGTGTFADIFTDTNGHIALPESKPTPPTRTPTVYFAGWYTAAEGGDKITEEYTFTENTTVYAHYVPHQHNFTYSKDGTTITAICANTDGFCYLPKESEIGPYTATLTITTPTLSAYSTTTAENISAEAVITDEQNIRGDAEVKYYRTDAAGNKAGDPLDQAPTEAGRYWAEITLDESNDQSTVHVVYTIDGMLSGVARYGGTLTAAEVTGATYAWESLEKENSTSGTTISSGNTYSLTANDVGKYIRVSITMGDVTLKRVTGPVAPAQYLKPILSETKIVTTSNSIKINGFYNASPLKEARYQFSSDGGETWTAAEMAKTAYTFSGLTGGTTYRLRVRSVANDSIQGVETSDILSVTTPANVLPLTGVSINGTAQVGNTLSAKPEPADATSLTYQWQSSDSESGTYSNISGATYATYSLTKDDHGKYIRIVATQSGTGAQTSTSVQVEKAPAVEVSTNSIRATATNTSITVTAPRSTATRNYEYSLDNGNWQTSNVFTFDPASNDTQKTIYVRTGGQDWQEVGTIGEAAVSVPGKPYPFDTAPTVVAQSFEYQGYTDAKAPTLNIGLKVGAATPAYQYRIGVSGEWQNWTSEAANSLSVGSYYYMRAVIAGNGNYHAYTTEPVTFAVTQNTTETRPAPITAPTVSDNSLVVTIAEADRGKALEYQVDGTAEDKWASVPTLNSDGQFTLGALSAASHKVNLRYRADSNYQKPSASVESANFTLSQYSVAYDANGGSGAPAPQTATSPATITVYAKNDKAHMPTRSGYTFDGWFDGSSDVSGQPVSAAKTLKAKWTANKYTIAFDANGGSNTMGSISNVAYDAVQKLTTNTFTRENYTFVGWATSAGGSVLYTDGQKVKNLTATQGGTVTLYAVWVADGKLVSGNVESGYPGTVELKLMRGSTQVGGTQVVTLELKESGKYEGSYSFTGVANGTYNLVAMQVVAKTNAAGGEYEEALVRTAAVTVSDNSVSIGSDSSGKIVMPGGDTSSEVAVKDDTPPVVVDGLDAEAASNSITDRSVSFTMTVESTNKSAAGLGAETADAMDAIENQNSIGAAEELSYLNIGIEKEVLKDGTIESKETVTETEKVITICIPYDMTGKQAYQIMFYRHHIDAQGNASTAPLTRDSARSIGNEKDGHFYVDQTGNMIYLYTNQFSTYAIGYNPDAIEPATSNDPGNSGHSGHSGSSGGAIVYTPDINTPQHGKVSVDPKSASTGNVVTITAEPDEGYAVDTVTVTNQSGDKVRVTKVNETTYTFLQPAGKVKIDVSFKEAAPVTTGPVTAPQPDVFDAFTDLDKDAWYRDGVKYVLENGIMNGMGDGIFAPNATTNRAMIVTMLWRMEGGPVVNYAMSYTDVDADAWYADAVRWAASEGIVTGYSETAFGPNDNVTREQLATILYRYAQSKGEGFKGAWMFLLDFPDAADVSAWADEAMHWMVMKEIITGMGDGTLNPGGEATRAQVATMLMRYHALITAT